MTYIRLYSIIAVISAMVALAPCTYSAHNEWDLKIELAKDQYVLHEPIWLDVTLTNIAADSQRTHGLVAPNHRQFYIELKDDAGRLMEYQGPMYFIAPGLGKLLLGPGKEDFGSFDLTQLFKSVEGTSGYAVIGDFPFIPTGTYSVQVLYEDAASNELAFSVVEPSGETKEVLELIERASSVWNVNITDPAVQVFREAVEQFPNSVFSERCYFLSIVYPMEAREKRKQEWDFMPVYTAMLENYPNSGDARDWIAALARRMDEPAKGDFLKGLAEAYPNTRTARYVRLMQERVSKQEGDR